MMIRFKCRDCGNQYDEEEKPVKCPCGNKGTSKKWDLIIIRDPPSEEHKKILSDPELFKKIVLESDKVAVGEEQAKKALILIAMGRLVKNALPTSFNAIPHEESGTGKDYLTRTITRLCVPTESLITFTRISPTVLNYFKKEDPSFSWDGKVLVLEDISDQVLNCEVFKTFLSGGSKAVLTKDGRAEEIEIKGKPAIIATTAKSTPGGEQLRRLQLIPLDAGKEQTARIKRFRAQYAEKGRKPEFDFTFQRALWALDSYNVLIPFASDVVEYFPDEIITRTVIDRFFDYIRSSAIIHQYQREKNEEGALIAKWDDYTIARESFLHTVSTSGSLYPMTINQKQLVKAIEEASNKVNRSPFEFVAVSDFIGLQTLEEKAVYNNLDKLVESRVLRMKKEIRDSTSNKEVKKYQLIEKKDFLLPTANQILEEKKRNELEESMERTERTENKESEESKERKESEEFLSSLSILSPPLASFSQKVPESPNNKHKTMRIAFSHDFSTFVGVDGVEYGPFKSGDLATVPIANAKKLVDRGLASIMRDDGVGIVSNEIQL